MKKGNLLITTILLLSGLFLTVNATAQGGSRPPRDGQHGERGGREGGERMPSENRMVMEAGGYKIGAVATDFELKNVDENIFSLSDIENAKGYIVVFTSNGCSFSKMYEDRLIALHNEYAPKGFSVIAINSKVDEISKKESFKAMQKRAEEKEFPFVYLADFRQKISRQYGALNAPHVFLLDSEKVVKYIGAIDDNAKNAEEVKTNYLENAIKALENGAQPSPDFTTTIGCTIKEDR